MDAMPGDPGVSSVIGPRLFIPARYVDSTKLLVAGSRASYEAYAKVERQTPANFILSIRSVLDKDSVRARTVEQGQTSITSDIDDLSNYLGIVGVVALLLGGIGVASGVSAWVRRKIDVVAVLRCLGATSRQVLLIYATQAGLMGLLGALMGAVLGVGIQFALPYVAKDFLPVDVHVALDGGSILTGLALGVWIALAFALRPLLALRRVSPLQAIRRDADPASLGGTLKDPARMAVNLLLAASVVGVSATRSQSLREVVGFSLAIGAVIGLLALSATTLSRLARRATRARWPYVIRQGIANLHRPANQTRSVVLSLGFGAFLMSTLYLVQANLLKQFAVAQASSRGNVVLFDVQDDQMAGLDSIVRASGSELLERTPIVTMRIAAINGTPTSVLVADTMKRLETWPIRREYRSSFRGETTPSERIVAGTWFGPTIPPVGTKVFEVSMEEEIARDLGVRIGDTIDWNVQGVTIPTRLTSTRAVNWARFETNFFAVFQPGALDKAPKMWVTLVRTTNDSAIGRLQRDAVVRYPNVASVDLTLIRRTIADIANRATLAIRFLAMFSLAMGVPVLFSAVAATRRERVREGVLLKVLGATRQQIGRILLSEYFALGVLGSLAGMVLSFGGAYGIMQFVFKRPFDPATGSALAIAGATLLLTVSIGMLSGRDVFHETPMGALREV
jgi:putative ABC transport system permease protein